MKKGRPRKYAKDKVMERLGALAEGKVNDAVALAFLDEENWETMLRGLDLSAVTEFKRHGNGGVEVKLVDRVEVLSRLAEMAGDKGAEALLEALERSAEEA